MLMNRNLLYTGVTRAGDCVTILGSSETVAAMIDNAQEQRRYSGLADRISEIEIIVICNRFMVFLDLLFPRRCPACDRVLAIGEMVCPQCTDRLTIIQSPFCRKCGKSADRQPGGILHRL